MGHGCCALKERKVGFCCITWSPHEGLGSARQTVEGYTTGVRLYSSAFQSSMLGERTCGSCLQSGEHQTLIELHNTAIFPILKEGKESQKV